jgi:hypothetical protein
MKFVVIVFILVLMSCQYGSLPDATVLEGKWIEATGKTDTLEFTFVGDREALLVRRGKEIRDGILLPKYNSGLYEYRLLSGKISLRWVAASTSTFNDYYFVQLPAGIEMDNFYDTKSSSMRMFFKKIK